MPAKAGERRFLNRYRRPNPCLLRGTLRAAWPTLQHLSKLQIIRWIGRLVTLENDRLTRPDSRFLALALHLPQIFNPLRLGQPHNLKRMIARQEPILIVVNRLAWPAQEPRRFVPLIAEN